jgi:hypothetical protein
MPGREHGEESAKQFHPHISRLVEQHLLPIGEAQAEMPGAAFGELFPGNHAAQFRGRVLGELQAGGDGGVLKRTAAVRAGADPVVGNVESDAAVVGGVGPVIAARVLRGAVRGNPEMPADRRGERLRLGLERYPVGKGGG